MTDGKASKNAILYIKADRNREVRHPDVTLGDILKMECTDEAVLARVKTIRLLRFHHVDDKHENRTAVSILKVIQCIHEQYPQLQVENMGETDFIVTYETQKTPGRTAHFLKAGAVTLISFFGAAFSTMAFNNDVDTVKMFAQIYELVTGRPSNGFTILEITYSLGLAIGILTFFNHFGKKKLSVDPTPMEVEMRLYENDIQTTLLETYARKEKELDVGTTDSTGSHRN